MIAADQKINTSNHANKRHPVIKIELSDKHPIIEHNQPIIEHQESLEAPSGENIIPEHGIIYEIR